MSPTDATLDGCRIIQGDALQVLPTLPEASVQLIVVDPPYCRVKLTYNGERVEWDRQWTTRDAYLDWLRQLMKQWRRLLAPNGSLYCFASPQMAAWVEVTLSEHFNVLNHIVWRKHDGSGAETGGHSKVCKEELMSYFPQTERILFAEQYGSDVAALGESGYQAATTALHKQVYANIGQYIAQERERAGLTRDQIDVGLGYVRTKNPHRGTELCRRWEEGSSLPTRETYERLRIFLNSQNCQHDYLRREYEDLRRPFTVSAAVPFTDVWEFPTVAAFPGKHPAEKPLPLLRHIILASSRSGDTVLDCCAGRGSTLEAARQCGRRAIGIEQDAKWYQAMAQRLSQRDLFTVPETQRQAMAPQQEALWPR